MPDPSASITIDRLYLHIPTKTGVSSNANSVLMLVNPDHAKSKAHVEGTFRFKRGPGAKPSKVYAEMSDSALHCTVVIPQSERSVRDALVALFEETTVICARDQKGNLIFGKIANLKSEEDRGFFKFSFDVAESQYSEAV